VHLVILSTHSTGLGNRMVGDKVECASWGPAQLAQLGKVCGRGGLRQGRWKWDRSGPWWSVGQRTNGRHRGWGT
jgi:hypothetical protein